MLRNILLLPTPHTSRKSKAAFLNEKRPTPADCPHLGQKLPINSVLHEAQVCLSSESGFRAYGLCCQILKALSHFFRFSLSLVKNPNAFMTGYKY